MLQSVTLKEIEQIFVVLDRLGVSREAVVIPLKPATPGSIRRLPNGKLEIVVDAQTPLDVWLEAVEPELRAAAGL